MHSGEPQTLEWAVDGDSHLAFLENILAKHDLPPKNIADMRKQMQRIQRRENDPRLFLGVIGEFSSGKSTLMNALLRDDLLKTSIIQATTSAPTALAYGAKLDVEVVNSNGNRVSYQREGISRLGKIWRLIVPPKHEQEKANLRDFLHQVTANEEVAKELEIVNVFHPARILEEGLVLIDTPGTNANNARHVEVTQEVLHDICDGAIIVIAPDNPCSASLKTFLMDHLSDVLHRCVFVLTKLDLIAQKDRERLLDMTRRRLQQELGLDEVSLHVVAPQCVVDQAMGIRPETEAGKLPPDQQHTMIAQFVEAEEDILNRLRAQRSLLQLERTTSLLRELLDQLRQILATKAETVRLEHEALEQNRLPDPSAHIDARCQQSLQALHPKMLEAKNQLASFIRAENTKAQEHMQQVIDEAQSKSELQTVILAQIQEQTQQATESVGKKLQSLQDQFARNATEQLGRFHTQFNEIFRNLATLGGRIQTQSRSHEPDAETALPVAISCSETGAATERISQDSAQEGNKVLIGMGAGAFTSLLLVGLGPIGLLAGSLFGGWLASLFGPSLSTLKSEYRPKVRSQVDEIFSKMEILAEQQLVEELEKIQTQLKERIRGYLPQYEKLIREMVQRDEARRQELRTLQQSIMQTIAECESRLQRLTQTQIQLRQFS